MKSCTVNALEPEDRGSAVIPKQAVLPGEVNPTSRSASRMVRRYTERDPAPRMFPSTMTHPPSGPSQYTILPGRRSPKGRRGPILALPFHSNAARPDLSATPITLH
jgi:hypothetical protein